MRSPIDLDAQASTPLAPEALEAMLPWLREGHWNPHSAHAGGRRAAAAIAHARDQVAALLPAGGRLAFTGSATEALNWAVKGSTGPIVTLATEHSAVLDSVAREERCGREVTVLPVEPDGRVDLRIAEAAIRPGTGLVTAMLVNNEIGVVQPVREMAELAHAAGALFLSDAVQGYGRIPVPDGCDMVALSGHKIYGPKGVGALWVRDGVELSTLLHGGRQEALGRSGTLSPALCVGLGAAAALMRERAQADAEHIGRLWQVARDRLGAGWSLNGSAEHRYHGNLNIRRDGVDAARLISEVREVAFSAGSACASGSGRPSHVLRAIDLSEAQARSSLRIGFGRYTRDTELLRGLDLLCSAAERQRAFAP